MEEDVSALEAGIEEARAFAAAPGSFATRVGGGLIFGEGRPSGIVLSHGRADSKLALARRLGRPGGIGVDLVHACTNDVLAMGAVPRLLAARIDPGDLEPSVVQDLVESITAGCRADQVALAHVDIAAKGGAPALAGTMVATLLGTEPLDAARTEPGDAVVGIGASGFHSDDVEFVMQALLPNSESCAPALARALLAPHKSYRGVLLTPIEKGWVRALVHVRAGGLQASLARALPAGLRARLDPAAWPLPPLLKDAAESAGLAQADLPSRCNAGVGMAAIVAPADEENFRHYLGLWNEPTWRIGQIESAP